jgi:hypothetical protein
MDTNDVVQQADIIRVIDDHPRLSWAGWGRWREITGAFDGYRAQMYDEDALHGVRLCDEWLRLVDYTTTVNRRSPSSYRLKHVVEDWAGTYIANGQFIVAGLLRGVPMREATPNPQFGISLRSLTALKSAKRTPSVV